MTHYEHLEPRSSQIQQPREFQQGTPPSVPPVLDTQTQGATLQGAFFWRRVLARSIDLVFTIPILIILYVIAYIPVEVIRALTTIPYRLNFAIDLFIDQLLFLIAIILHDASALAIFGTTIGKALFGIQVKQADGKKACFTQAMFRTERMLYSNFYLIGFPILMSPFVVASFSHIKRTGSSTWDDRAKTVLSVRTIGPLRRFVAYGLGIVAFMTVVIADRVGKNQTKAELKAEVVSEMLTNIDTKKHPPISYDPARYASWETVLVPGICTFQIPPTMELQSEKYQEIVDEFRNQVLQVTESENRVVAQQKGLNTFDPTARTQYARVIVETHTGSRGDFNILGTPLNLSQADVEEIDAETKTSVQKEAARSTAAGFPMEVQSWDGTRVVRVNGIDCLLTEYSRSVNNAPPASVRLYKFLNNDRLHTIGVSYRITEANVWATDLEKIVTTFQFTWR